ncbi:amino acid adenylation domain protein [Calothrix sp. NIES-4101]|nr:amino acid adenylation domain protein [Calothrix sp. NIES-4101]
MTTALEYQELFSQKNYWLDKLSGELPETNFTQDYVRPTHYNGKNKVYRFEIPNYLSQEIINLTNGSNFLVYLMLLSAFKILLQKYTRTNDLIVGIPVYKNIDGVNIDDLSENKLIPLRTQLCQEMAFKNFLIQVKDSVIQAYSHPNYCFDELIELLKLPQAKNRCSLFDVAILLENIHNPTEIVNINNDITVSFLLKNDAISASIEYSDTIFTDENIRLISHYYINTIKNIVSNIDIKISDIRILDDFDIQTILKQYNNNVQEYPITQTINELFVEQVSKNPNNIAVVHDQATLTYQELNDKSNQLAKFLCQQGLNKGEFVGIFKNRDLNFLVAILAILKAGGAYVPIDSSYPLNRIEYMLSNSEVRFIFTDVPLLNVLTDFVNNYSQLKSIILLDDVVPKNIQLNHHQELIIYSKFDFINLPQQNLEVINQAIDIAYMIYTSGSTGLPKGTIVRHDGAINHIYAQFDELKLTDEFCFLQSAPSSTDISVWQFLAPLLIGGKTVIVDIETVAIPEKLFQVIKSEKITVVELVPALFRGLLEYISQLPNNERRLPDLQWMMLSGESVSTKYLNEWLEIYPDIKIANAYGPTEAADDITQFIVDKPFPENQRTVPIGKPLANLNLYILDEQMKLLPIGAPGEICVSGIGVGAGYWKNEEKTKFSFVPNPFTETRKNLPGNRKDLIYKTGDLGRWLPDGNIEFLGRIDHQVKIRGFRVELGEIEAFLSQHPSVHENVVVAHQEALDNVQLVAYVVARWQLVPSISELRSFLKEKLPEHMIPSAFVMLESLPLAPSGKVDRKALPKPDTITFQVTSTFAVPRNPVEEVLTGIWTQVLGVSQIGIHDNFFELGGHSLLATQVISRIRKTFEVDISLRCLFEFPTIAELAQNIQVANYQGASAITLAPRDRNLPLSFAQTRLWLLEQINPGSDIYNMPAAVHFMGELNVEALEKSINEIIRRHEVLRTIFTVLDGQPLQVIVPDAQLKIPVMSLQKLPKSQQEIEIERLSIQEFQLAFNLTQAPLLRCKLLQLGEQEYILLFAIHHIVFDAWSQGILIKEIAALYNNFVARKPNFLPPLSIQYVDFAVWQRQHLQGERRESLLTYWKQQLANLPTLQLPTTRPRAEVRTNRGASYSFVIPVSVVQEMRSLSQQAGVTLFMTLLASFKILLQRYSHQDDIIVGTDVANRNQTEIEQLIGFFVNLLVLRTDLSENPTFLELLQRVRTQTLAAYAHQDLPFDELVRELQPERQVSNTVPLFQVLFVLQNTPNSTLELPGVSLKLLEVESKTARFDLALFLTESEQGIEAKWQYNADLFTSDTITTLTKHWQTLINNILTQPQRRINTLEMLTEEEKVQQTMQQQERKTAKKQKFMSIAPKAVSLSVEQLIKADYLQAGQKFPLVIQPDSIDVDLISWAENNGEYLETELLKHGAILFRDFQIKSVSEFENFAQTICPNLFAEYGDLPRTGEGGKVYGSTPYPADKAILFHNESSHLHCFPLKIWFYCVQPAICGGETPIVDCRQAYQLLSPQLREKLASKQLMYVRNFAEGLDVSWQNFFQTTEKKEVENYCLQAGMEFEWYAENGLVTRQIRPALAIHPKTGEPVFFNQVQLHHISYLDTDVRESLLSIFGESKLPRNVYFGDGTTITETEIDEINTVYQRSQTCFPWQKGDIIMLDNLLAAHGRNPFVGQRKIVVAMAEMVNNKDINNPSN